jgi:two-component sensor histidine kinase
VASTAPPPSLPLGRRSGAGRLALSSWLRGVELRSPRGVRTRVALLLLLAAVPMLLLAAVIAWQAFRMVAAQPLDRARLVRAASAARYQAMLEDAAGVLAGLAGSPAVTAGGAACETALRDALALYPARFGSLLVLDAAGRVECSAGPVVGVGEGAAASWFRAARERNGFAIGELADGGKGLDRAVLTAAVPRFKPEGFAGVVAGGVLLDWPASPLGPEPPAHAWLIDTERHAVALGSAPAAALPAEPAFTALRTEEPRARIARARDGTDYAYAVKRLEGNLRLLVATPAAADEAAARADLLRRLAGLLLLLGIGLAGVAFGADRALVAPIRRLSAAVRASRGGEAFDPGPRQGLPAELAQLAASFAAATAALAEREAELRGAVAQQELLLQEIHHRVKNNLQIVASLMNLQASRIRLPEAKREFAAARDRIRALATLHRHLYAHGDLQTISMDRFLHELCHQLLQALGESAGGRIRLEIEASALQMSSDQAVPIALIVTEAVSNAAKYAFPDGRTGRIRVSLAAVEGRARLVIQDDGVGLPSGPLETESGARDGIGLHLIRGFARQLGAELAVTQRGGTRYQLDLELRHQRDEAEDTSLAAD